jgi:CubicO group peptidase (beta-lactamase class C family)
MSRSLGVRRERFVSGPVPLASRDELAAAVLERSRLPGLVAATFHSGEIDWRCALGDTSGRYRIGSITKTLTAVLVLQLRDERRIDLDDPVGKHLADAPYVDHTIRSLLSHGSGMTAEPAGMWWERVPGGSWADLVAANQEPIDVFRPGQRHHYSNLGYALLGELVARLRGCSWWEAVQQRLLAPLGMTATTYDAGEDAAVGTSRNPETGQLMREPAEDSGAMAPAGQLWSTLDDLARWGDFLVSGHHDVLRSETLIEMRTSQAADPDFQHIGAYGLGFRLHWTPTGTLVGHTGSMPGFLAGLLVDPVNRVGAVLLTNATTGVDPEAVAAQLQALAASDVAPRVDDGAGEVDRRVDELVGTWYWGNTAMQLEATDEGFVLGEKTWRRFRTEDVDVYRGLTGYWAGERLDVRRHEDGSVAYLEVVTFILTRTPYDECAPIPGGPPTPL